MVAIPPVNTLDPQSGYAATSAKTTPQVKQAASSIDTVWISDEAQQRLRAEMANNAMVRESQQQEEITGPTWEMGGLKTGTFTLKNGNVQNVNIDGDTLTIEEFRNGKLVKATTGIISEDGMVLDTEYFDSSGRVSQSIHTEIVEGETKNGWTSSAMSREIKWFEGGKLKGEMQDNTLLQTRNLNEKADEDTTQSVKKLLGEGTEAINTNFDDLAQSLTVEKQHADYFAQIKEYGVDEGALAREITIEQNGRYTQASNRSYDKVGQVEGRTTHELKRETGLVVHIKDYDADGELVRDARFTDEQTDEKATTDGKLEQTLDVSWYNKGDLVKRSHGFMSFEETATMGLPDRPGFLELFGMDDEEYLGDKPKSAMELMTTKPMTNGSEAGVFTEGLEHHINDRDYNPAEGIGQYGETQRPYSISWTDEIYSDGELVMRQSDRESAKETSFWQQERGMLFRKGGALTENAAPSVVRESSHEREVFDDNGRLVSHQSVQAKERVEVDHDGPDTVRTKSTYIQGTPGNEDTTVVDAAGGIEGADQDPNAAARGFAAELQLTLEDLREKLRSLNEEDADKATDHRIHPRFRV